MLMWAMNLGFAASGAEATEAGAKPGGFMLNIGRMMIRG